MRSPARPNPSGRVAVTVTRSVGTPSVPQRTRRIASRTGAIEGRSAMTVRSAETG
jgi:hypothetical protein